MIKIRYSDLPQGRHAHVHTAGRRSVIYLLPGLSPAQRRDALRRLIRTSRQGYGPRLRAPGVRFAVARDVTKTTARNALAAVRCHPAGSTALAALIAAGVICYAFFVTVTVRFTPHPAGPPVAAPPGRRSPGAGPREAAPVSRRAPSPRSPGAATASARRGRAGIWPRNRPRNRRRAVGPGDQIRAAAHRHLVSPGGRAAVRLGRAVVACLVPAVRHAIAGAVGGAAPGPPRAAPPAIRAGCAWSWVRSASASPASPGNLPAGRREVLGEPPRLGSVHGDERDLGRALPAHQGRGRRGLGSGSRLRAGGRGGRGAAAHRRAPQAGGGAARALALAGRVRVRGDHPAVAVPVRRGTAAVQLDERPARRVGADHRGGPGPAHRGRGAADAAALGRPARRAGRRGAARRAGRGAR